MQILFVIKMYINKFYIIWIQCYTISNL